MAGVVRVQGADQLGVRDMVRPVDPQGLGRTAQPRHGAARGGGQRTQDAGPGRDHEVGRGHACEQRDLGVPAVGGERGAVFEAVHAVPLDDLLLGDVERDPAALDLQLLPQQPDVLEQRRRLLGGARVDLPLHPRVVELGPAAYQRPPHLGRDRAAFGVEVELPEQRGCGPVGQQAGRGLAEHGRMERDLLVREVQRLYAAVCLGVERAAGCDEGGDVGDRVVHPVAPAAAGEVHRLVEVDGARRVDGEERDVGGVGLGQARGPGGGFRLGEDYRAGSPPARRASYAAPGGRPAVEPRLRRSCAHGGGAWTERMAGWGPWHPVRWRGGRTPCPRTYEGDLPCSCCCRRRRVRPLPGAALR